MKLRISVLLLFLLLHVCTENVELIDDSLTVFGSSHILLCENVPNVI